MRYPSSRKSPFKHRVRKHTRSGKPVRSYERGRGKEEMKRRVSRAIRPSKPVVAERGGRDGMFNVTVEYVDRVSDFITVTSEDYANAIDKGMITRNAITPPKAIILTKVS